MDIFVEILHEKDYPQIIQECLTKISKKLQYSIEEMTVSWADTVVIALNESYIQGDYFNAWAQMKAYYGFEVEYEDGFFSVGGCETEEIRAETLDKLLVNLNKMRKQ